MLTLRTRRLFGLRGISLICFLLLVGFEPKTAIGESIGLKDLDLSKIQLDSGESVVPKDIQTGEGIVLPAGSRFWIDLQKSGKTFSCLVEGRGAARKFRVFTGREMKALNLASAGGIPVSFSLPLDGERLLAIEVEGDSGSALIRDSLIGYSGEKPIAWKAGISTSWRTSDWAITTDGRTGGMTTLSAPMDPFAMNWVKEGASWGTGVIRTGRFKGAWETPSSVRKTGPQSIEITYRTSILKIVVRREIDPRGYLSETYTFTNTTTQPLELPEGSMGIRVPLPDEYPGADLCLTNRCNAHLWMGGDVSYVNGLRMGGAAPHLGLVLTSGRLIAYSLQDRPPTSNDRGQFVVHPAAQALEPGSSFSVSWILFWHEGWRDFFAKAAAVPGFFRVEAERYTVTKGEPLRIRVQANESLKGARVLAQGEVVPIRSNSGNLEVQFSPTALGEQKVEVQVGGRSSFLRAFVAPPVWDLIRARLDFIIDHQQRHERGSPLDGAYLIYDNQAHQQYYASNLRDHNAGRERLAMGVLGALYLPHCDEPIFKKKLLASLLEYWNFVERELQNDTGVVYDSIGRSGDPRMYNYPWVVQLHLAMYGATHDVKYLRRMVETCRAYYQRKGEAFYCIGMPIFAGLAALKKTGWSEEYDELLKYFRSHADVMLKNGTAYPKHEVNYEQSIVGPAAQILLETYLSTGVPQYLEGAKAQLKCLEMFNGQQPDYHLHDIAIRHWDDFWFGKQRLYGDTLPHYWSTITGVVFHWYARAVQDPEFEKRAQGIFLNNLCAFSPEGQASCAYVYPSSINDQPGRFFDAWANDQDWALVNWIVAQ